MKTRELKRLEPSEGFTSKPDLTVEPTSSERKSSRTTKTRDTFEPYLKLPTKGKAKKARR